MATKAKLPWGTDGAAINPATLPPDAKAAYESLQKCFEATRKAKAKLEPLLAKLISGNTFPDDAAFARIKAVQTGLAAGRSLKCAYLSGITVLAVDAPATKASKSGVSLAA